MGHYYEYSTHILGSERATIVPIGRDRDTRQAQAANTGAMDGDTRVLSSHEADLGDIFIFRPGINKQSYSLSFLPTSIFKA